MWATVSQVVVQSGYKMRDDELMESKFSPLLPDLMPQDCSSVPATSVLSSELSASQPVHVSSCGSTGSRLSRSGTLMPPLVSLLPSYTSSTQHQQDNISAELSSGATLKFKRLYSSSFYLIVVKPG